jgi:hypothetical protein
LGKKPAVQPAPELHDFIRRVYEIYAGKPPADSVAEFYPYTGINSTIRFQRGKLLVRISDLLGDAPPDVLHGLIHKLVARLFRKKPPIRQIEAYENHVKSPEIRERGRQARAVRGRKSLRPPQGETHDLSRIFTCLNREFFEERLQVRDLGWSLRRSRRRLGHYDPAHRTIVIDRRLDLPVIPEYVVAYVVYHEMLHAWLGEEERGGIFHVHHPRFREAERRYPEFRRATDFIRRHFR